MERKTRSSAAKKCKLKMGKLRRSGRNSAGTPPPAVSSASEYIEESHASDSDSDSDDSEVSNQNSRRISPRRVSPRRKPEKTKPKGKKQLPVRNAKNVPRSSSSGSPSKTVSNKSSSKEVSEKKSVPVEKPKKPVDQKLSSLLKGERNRDAKEQIKETRIDIKSPENPVNPDGVERIHHLFPGMINNAEELIIDGFAIIAFVTKEDQDTFFREKWQNSDKVKSVRGRESMESDNEPPIQRSGTKLSPSIHSSETRYSPVSSANPVGGAPSRSAGKNESLTSANTVNNAEQTDERSPRKPSRKAHDTDNNSERSHIRKKESCQKRTSKTPGVERTEEESASNADENCHRVVENISSPAKRTKLPASPQDQTESEDPEAVSLVKRNSSPPSSSIEASRAAADSSSCPVPSISSSSSSSSQAHNPLTAPSSNSLATSIEPSANNGSDCADAIDRDIKQEGSTGASSSPREKSAKGEREHRDREHRSSKEREHRRHKEQSNKDRHREEKSSREEKDTEKPSSSQKRSTPRPESGFAGSSRSESSLSHQKSFNPVLSPNSFTSHTPVPFQSPPPQPFSSSPFSSNPFAPNPAAFFPGQSAHQFPGARWGVGGMFGSATMMAPGAAAAAAAMSHPFGMLGSSYDRPGGFFGFPSMPPSMGSSASAFPPSSVSLGAHSLLGNQVGGGNSSFPGFPPSMPGLPSLGSGFPSPPGALPLPTLPQSAASAASAPKKQGKWCAMHVRIAWEIYNHQQRQPGQGQPGSESLKLGGDHPLTSNSSSALALTGNRDFNPMTSKMPPLPSLPSASPSIPSGLYSRPGAANDLASSLLQQNNRLSGQPMGWPLRPPYFPGMPSNFPVPGLGFPSNPLVGNRDLMASSFPSAGPAAFPDTWRRPMAFGGLANPSPTGQSSSSSTSNERKNEPDRPDKKQEPSSDSTKRSHEESGSSADRDSSGKKKRLEENQTSSRKLESPKDHRGTPDSRKSADVKKSSRETEKEREKSGDNNAGKAIDLRSRSDSTVSGFPPDKIKSSSGAGLSPNSGFSGSESASSMPSFLPSAMDRNGLFGPSLPGFPPMWPSFDPMRAGPSSFAAMDAAQREMLLQSWRMRQPGAAAMPNVDFLRAMQQGPFLDKNRFPPYNPAMMNAYMRSMEGLTSGQNAGSEPRRSPTPMRSSRETTALNGKDSPTDLSQNRTKSGSKDASSKSLSSSSSRNQSSTKAPSPQPKSDKSKS